jgi:hypothetical protein
MKVRLSLCIVAALLLLPIDARAQAPAGKDAYLGAEGCKTCHTAIYDAWAKTKHAKAINRLSGSEKASGKCIGCHVTGSPEMIVAEAAHPSFPNVQCESCHGAGKAHAAKAATDKTALEGVTKKLRESNCTNCHNDRSPHFKGFSYDGMKWFVHKTS